MKLEDIHRFAALEFTLSDSKRKERMFEKVGLYLKAMCVLYKMIDEVV